MHNLLSSLHSETINQYWLGALFLTLVLSTISVVLSHLQQPRQHAGWRLISDLLVREQLAFLSYGFALYISAYVQAEQKALGPWFGILSGLGLLFSVLGVWFTAPSRLSKLHNGVKKCPEGVTEACPEVLRPAIKWKLVGVPLLFFVLSCSLAVVLALEVVEPKPKANIPVVGTLVPSDVGIALVRAGADAYRDQPAFIRDNLDKLDDEQRTAKRPDHVVAVIESGRLSTYGKFCWTVSLAEDYQTDFALSSRAAYLLHDNRQPGFRDLLVRGVGQPFTSTVAEIHESFDGDKVLLVLAIYARLPGKKVLREIDRMFHTEVNCP